MGQDVFPAPDVASACFLYVAAAPEVRVKLETYHTRFDAEGNGGIRQTESRFLPAALRSGRLVQSRKHEACSSAPRTQKRPGAASAVFNKLLAADGWCWRWYLSRAGNGAVGFKSLLQHQRAEHHVIFQLFAGNRISVMRALYQAQPEASDMAFTFASGSTISIPAPSSTPGITATRCEPSGAQPWYAKWRCRVQRKGLPPL